MPYEKYIQCHCVHVRVLAASSTIFMLKVILVIMYMYSIVHFNLYSITLFLSKVCCTGHHTPFLNILQSLLSLERDDPTLDTVWEGMEQFCCQTVHSSYSGHQGDRQNGVSIENLRMTSKKQVRDDSPTGVVAGDSPSQVEMKLHVRVETGPPPPPPPAPGGPQPPPPPPGAPRDLAPTSEKMTKVAKARAYRPQKKMNKVNWSKLSRGPATNVGAIWQKAADGEMDTEVDIDPARVEELFAKPDVMVEEEKTKTDDEKGQTGKVCVEAVDITSPCYVVPL